MPPQWITPFPMDHLGDPLGYPLGGNPGGGTLAYPGDPREDPLRFIGGDPEGGLAILV